MCGISRAAPSQGGPQTCYADEVNMVESCHWSLVNLTGILIVNPSLASSNNRV